MSTFCTSAAEYWLTQIDRSFGYPGYSEHSGSPGLRIPEPPAIFSLLRCIVEVEVSFPFDRSVTGRRQIRSPLLGRLAEPTAAHFSISSFSHRRLSISASPVLTRTPCLASQYPH